MKQIIKEFSINNFGDIFAAIHRLKKKQKNTPKICISNCVHAARTHPFLFLHLFNISWAAENDELTQSLSLDVTIRKQLLGSF